MDIGLTEGSVADRLVDWLAYSPHKGVSSTAIALTALGKIPEGRHSNPPWDPADLRRCLLLLDEVPEAFEIGVRKLAEVRTEWKSLLDVWDVLVATMMEEAGADWKNASGRAPKTYMMMRAVLD